jgi:hypothetical protein
MKKVFLFSTLLFLSIAGINIYGQELSAYRCADGKWGFIDRTGSVVIPCRYDNVVEFYKGIARVQLNRKWGCIRENGEEVIPIEHSYFKIYHNRSIINALLELYGERERLVAQERERLAAQERERLVAQETTPKDYDIIHLKNGDEIKAKVTEITLSEIKYKAFEYLDGATITLRKKDVSVINNANGTRVVLGATAASKNCAKKTAFGLDIGIGGG